MSTDLLNLCNLSAPQCPIAIASPLRGQNVRSGGLAGLGRLAAGTALVGLFIGSLGSGADTKPIQDAQRPFWIKTAETKSAPPVDPKVEAEEIEESADAGAPTTAIDDLPMLDSIPLTLMPMRTPAKVASDTDSTVAGPQKSESVAPQIETAPTPVSSASPKVAVPAGEDLAPLPAVQKNPSAGDAEPAAPAPAPPAFSTSESAPKEISLENELPASSTPAPELTPSPAVAEAVPNPAPQSQRRFGRKVADRLGGMTKKLPWRKSKPTAEGSESTASGDAEAPAEATPPSQVRLAKQPKAWELENALKLAPIAIAPPATELNTNKPAPQPRRPADPKLTKALKKVPKGSMPELAPAPTGPQEVAKSETAAPTAVVPPATALTVVVPPATASTEAIPPTVAKMVEPAPSKPIVVESAPTEQAPVVTPATPATAVAPAPVREPIAAVPAPKTNIAVATKPKTVETTAAPTPVVPAKPSAKVIPVESNWRPLSVDQSKSDNCATTRAKKEAPAEIVDSTSLIMPAAPTKIPLPAVETAPAPAVAAEPVVMPPAESLETATSANESDTAKKTTAPETGDQPISVTATMAVSVSTPASEPAPTESKKAEAADAGWTAVEPTTTVANAEEQAEGANLSAIPTAANSTAEPHVTKKFLADAGGHLNAIGFRSANDSGVVNAKANSVDHSGDVTQTAGCASCGNRYFGGGGTAMGAPGGEYTDYGVGDCARCSGVNACGQCVACCYPGANRCYPCNETSTWGRLMGIMYECLCCPDPCYELSGPHWVPAANAAWFLDHARPRGQTRLRATVGYELKTPDAALYFFAQSNGSGLGPYNAAAAASQVAAQQAANPGGTVQVVGISRVNYTDFDMYVETCTKAGKFSAWVNTKFRGVTPNAPYVNHGSGFGDLDTGTKSLLLDSELTQVSFQMRTFVPTGNFATGTGTGVVRIEPSILYAVKLCPGTYLEGQIGDWISIGGSYAGTILEVNQAVNTVLWELNPDCQMIGTVEYDTWTFLSGNYTDPTVTVGSSTSGILATKSANMMYYSQLGLGIRFSFCNRLDFGCAAAYSIGRYHWAEQTYRTELRLMY